MAPCLLRSLSNILAMTDKIFIVRQFSLDPLYPFLKAGVTLACLKIFGNLLSFALKMKKVTHIHCVKSVQIWSFFWSIFPCFRNEYGDLQSTGNTDQKNTGKYGPKENPYFRIFHALVGSKIICILFQNLYRKVVYVGSFTSAKFFISLNASSTVTPIGDIDRLMTLIAIILRCLLI